MSHFIDRRPHNRHKSAVNRDRFMRRFKTQIQKAVSDAISNRKISNIKQGENITLPAKDISEPIFQYGKGGRHTTILPGNTHFTAGDKIKRPTTDAEGSGSQASNTGISEDDFVFHLSKKEFLDLFFENLELPNLVQTELHQLPVFKTVRAGFAKTGVPANIHLVRSLRSAIGRRLSAKGSCDKKLSALEKDLDQLKKTKNASDEQMQALLDKIEKIKKRKKNIPFIDPIDIRYNQYIRQPQPASQAVMFCIMDVSGSMDEIKKDIAKRFFILLYLFLTQTYEKIELVFIRHHTSAKEVSEKDFFYSRETGGTVVSSALEVMKEIIEKRYSTSQWNIYGAQASDGDNWNNDSPKCHDLLYQDIMPYVQYFAYVEIMPRQHQSLWSVYQKINKAYEHFSMQSIRSEKDIYPVFRSLFEKKDLQTKQTTGAKK